MRMSPTYSLEAELENTYAHMRSIDTAANYINVLDQIIQAVVTYKVYKMNRTTTSKGEVILFNSISEYIISYIL